MNAAGRRLTLLRVVLAAVIAVQSVGPALAPGSSATGHLAALAGFVRVIAGIELLAAALLMLPWTARIGAWLLLSVLVTAIAVHLLHGDAHVAWLVLAAAASWAVRPLSRATTIG